MPRAGRTPPLSRQASGLRLWREEELGREECLAHHIFFFLNCLSQKDRVLWLRHPNLKKKWTLQNTFSLTLRSPSVKPPNSSPVPDKSASPLRLLPYPCIMTGVLTMDRSHILSFLQPITDCALPILLYLLWGILFCWLGFVVVLFGGRGKSESHT